MKNNNYPLTFLLVFFSLNTFCQTYEIINSSFTYKVNGTPRTYYPSKIQGTHLVNDKIVYMGIDASNIGIFLIDGKSQNAEVLITPDSARFGLGDKNPERLRNAANSGNFLYFYLQDKFQTENFNLWTTDGTKEGTRKSSFKIEKPLYPPGAYNSSLVGDYFFPSTRENGEDVTYIVDGKNHSAQKFKVNISVQGVFFNEGKNNSNYLFYRKYTLLNDNTLQFEPKLHLYNVDNGEERNFTLDGLDESWGVRFYYIDNEKAFLSYKTADGLRNQLWELDLVKMTKRMIFESSNVDIFSSNGLDIFTKFVKLPEGFLFLIDNTVIDAEPLPTLVYFLKDENSSPEKLISLSGSGYAFNYFYFRNSIFIKEPTKLYKSDGTSNGTKLIKEFPNADKYYDELRGVIQEPEMQVVKDKLLIYSRTSNSDQKINDYTIWQMENGNNEPTIFLNNLRGFSPFYEINGKYYFTDHSFIYEGDGTPNGMKKIITLPTHADSKFDKLLNWQGSKDKVTLYDIFKLDDKLLVSQVFNRGQEGNFSGSSYAQLVFNNNYESLLNAYNANTTLTTGDGTHFFSFDPATLPKSCESLIMQKSLSKCINDPAYVVFKKYPESKIEWYADDMLLENSQKDSILLGASAQYKVKTTYKNCSSFSNIINVNVNAPVVTLSLPNAQSTPHTLQINAKEGYRETDGSTKNWKAELFLENESLDIRNNPTFPFSFTSTREGEFKALIKDSKGCEGVAYLTKGSGSGNSGGNNASINSQISSTTSSAYFPSTIKLSATINSGYTYQWQKDGVNIVGATSSTYEAKESGNYSVIITSGDKSATSNVINVSILVPVGTEPVLSSNRLELNIFPNPATEKVTAEVKLKEQKSLELVLRTLDGRIIQSWKSDNESTFHQHSFLINKSFSSQTLFLEATSENEHLTKKVIFK